MFLKGARTSGRFAFDFSPVGEEDADLNSRPWVQKTRNCNTAYARTSEQRRCGNNWAFGLAPTGAVNSHPDGSQADQH